MRRTSESRYRWQDNGRPPSPRWSASAFYQFSGRTATKIGMSAVLSVLFVTASAARGAVNFDSGDRYAAGDYRAPLEPMSLDPNDFLVDSIGNASAANNDLTKFGDTSRPDIVGWLLHNKPAIRFSGGDGLKNDSPTNLTGISNLSVGGVIRVDSPVSGEDTIIGVWDEDGERCWRLYLNNSQHLALDLSTNGTTVTTYTMTDATIDEDRNTFVYATWDGNTGAATLYLDAIKQNVPGAATSPLHSSSGPLAMGCSLNNSGQIDDSLVGVIGIVMTDDVVLTPTEIEYRAEEFTARRGTYLNTLIVP